MDTPLPAQVRPLDPGAEAATDEDVVELLEMILGAIGRDALGGRHAHVVHNQPSALPAELLRASQVLILLPRDCAGYWHRQEAPVVFENMHSEQHWLSLLSASLGNPAQMRSAPAQMYHAVCRHGLQRGPPEGVAGVASHGPARQDQVLRRHLARHAGRQHERQGGESGVMGADACL